MPIFTMTIAEPEMVPIRRLARQLDVAESEALKLILCEGLRRTRAVQEEEDRCPLDRMPAQVGEEVGA